MNTANGADMDDDSRMILDGLTRFLADAGGIAAAQKADGLNADLWCGLSQDLGLTGLPIAEDRGGLGLGLAILVPVLNQLGQYLLPVPYVSTVGIAAAVLEHAAAGPIADHWLTAIAEGAATATLAGWTCDAVTARKTDAGYVLDGTFATVPDLAGADVVLVPAMLDGAGALFALTPDSGVTPLDPLDRTRPLARFDLHGVTLPADARIDAPDFGTAFAYALDRARLALAAEAAGAARGAFDTTAAYIAGRHQFGRAIASFQAIKHRMAALFVRINALDAVIAGAAQAFDAGDPLAGFEARATWAMARDVQALAASEAIQLHGGVGITEEYAPHLWFKRAHAQLALYGAPEGDFAVLGRALLNGELAAFAETERDAFRKQAGDWLAKHLTDRFAPLVDRGGAGDGDALVDLRKDWERELASCGWTGLGLPKSVGGRGFDVAQQVAWGEEYARAGGPGRMGHIGEGLVAPTLLAFGTDDQKARFLPGILNGTTFWAQGYSEPGAGSDLGAVRTKARIDPASGDWRVTGQKIWTSLAHVSDWVFVLARAEEGSVGRHGLILLLMPLDQPGISIRPIRQINGGAEFNEVFFDDAVAKATDAIGASGDGWRIATALLGHERGISTLGQQMGFARELDLIVRIARDSGTDCAARLGAAWAGLRAMRHGALRMLTAQEGGTAGPELLGYKYEWSEWHRALGELALAVMGPQGAVWSDDADRNRLQNLFLFSRSETIYGGTSEIQLNIIAEQGLGMPREPRGAAK